MAGHGEMSLGEGGLRESCWRSYVSQTRASRGRFDEWHLCMCGAERVDWAVSVGTIGALGVN